MAISTRRGTPKRVQWGKVIDQDKCIGCHACTVACKAEHSVPLGVTRTFVKQVEVGVYPTVGRVFQVTRCNQCADPPCVHICPVTAMFQREDGIVDFDRDVCIGCKACMAACPYDAIYIDPESRSAEKCNFCAHRIDAGVEPACVAVCPERAIIIGDLNDPNSEVSQILARKNTAVRRPEKGTDPKLFYVGSKHQSLLPTLAGIPPMHMWSERHEGYPGAGGTGAAAPAFATIPVDAIGELAPDDGLPDALSEILEEATLAPRAKSGASPEGARAASTHFAPQGRVRPRAVEPSRTAAAALLAYEVPHRAPWDWRVSSYTWTKSIASGLGLLWSVGVVLNAELTPGIERLLPSLTAAFLLATVGLLVGDLEHPGRFLRVIFRPQWRSWLVRGACILLAYGALVTLWLGGAWLGYPHAGLWVAIAPLSVLAAVYTAFLFGQATARDLWQNPLLPFHFLVHAVLAGAATILAVGTANATPLLAQLARSSLVGSSVLFILLLLSELAMPHPTQHARRAADQLIRGRYRTHFWTGFLAGGVLPLVIALAAPGLGVLAGLLALGGLYAYEHAYVQAGQSVPLS